MIDGIEGMSAETAARRYEASRRNVLKWAAAGGAAMGMGLAGFGGGVPAARAQEGSGEYVEVLALITLLLKTALELRHADQLSATHRH